MRGDHVYIQCFGYTHHGIDTGNGIIHFSKRNGKSKIRKTSWEEFSDGKIVYLVEYESHLPIEETVKLAHSKLGFKDYNLLFSNCEHFARWCKIGIHISFQVVDAPTNLIITLLDFL
jgi:hypothetical protein